MVQPPQEPFVDSEYEKHADHDADGNADRDLGDEHAAELCSNEVGRKGAET